MKIFSKNVAVAVLATAAAVCAAEEFDLTAKEFWKPLKKVEFSDGQMTHTGRVMFTSKKVFALDPEKKYTLEIDVTSGDGKKRNFFLVGFMPTNRRGKGISAVAYQCIPDSYTEIVDDVKKNDTVIKVKDASSWINGGYVTFGAKEDFSDIPNTKFTKGSVVKKVQKDDFWIVTINKPANINASAGTFVRQHVGGGYYYLWNGYIAPNKTVHIKRSITGKAQHGRFSVAALHPAVKYGSFVILSDWNNGKTPVTIENAKLIIE